MNVRCEDFPVRNAVMTLDVTKTYTGYHRDGTSVTAIGALFVSQPVMKIFPRGCIDTCILTDADTRMLSRSGATSYMGMTVDKTNNILFVPTAQTHFRPMAESEYIIEEIFNVSMTSMPEKGDGPEIPGVGPLWTQVNGKIPLFDNVFNPFNPVFSSATSTNAEYAAFVKTIWDTLHQCTDTTDPKYDLGIDAKKDLSSSLVGIDMTTGEVRFALRHAPCWDMSDHSTLIFGGNTSPAKSLSPSGLNVDVSPGRLISVDATTFGLEPDTADSTEATILVTGDKSRMSLWHYKTVLSSYDHVSGNNLDYTALLYMSNENLLMNEWAPFKTPQRT